jgi:hypothetical protein
MNILFVENRYRTGFWEAVARELQTAGHRISWLVQNHRFRPETGETFLLPYPTGPYRGKKIYEASIKKVISADRGVNYFGVPSDDHFFQYRDAINELVERIQPDVAFGESTLFHELLTANACRQQGIYYLHPISCRYPTSRFCFYQYDTQQPLGGSGDELPLEKALSLVEAIASHSVKPDYMIPQVPPTTRERLADRLRLLRGYAEGERYNTPLPWRKMQLSRDQAQLEREWDSLAVERIYETDQRVKVLYPMHYQPESNIDVWANPYRNQLAVIQSIVNQLRNGEVLYVKPNPKSSYVFTAELLNYIRQHSDRVVALSRTSRMPAILPHIDLVFTVSGTIAMECIFSNKPVVKLVDAVHSNAANCPTLKNGQELRFWLEQVKKGTFPRMTPIEQAQHLSMMNSISYPGLIGDTLIQKSYAYDAKNFANVTSAFKSVLSLIEQNDSKFSPSNQVTN